MGLLLVSAGFTITAMVTGLRRKWVVAARHSRTGLFVALAAIILPAAALFAISHSFKSGATIPDAWIGVPADDTSHKANYLADAISELINCAALAMPAAIFAGAVWAVVRNNIKRGARSA